MAKAKKNIQWAGNAQRPSPEAQQPNHEVVLRQDLSKIQGMIASITDNQSKRIAIKSQTDADTASLVTAEIAAYKSRIGAFWDEDISRAHKLHKSLVAKRKKFLDPANSLESEIKAAVTFWVNAEKRKAEDLQRDLAVAAKEVGLPPPVVEAPRVEGLRFSEAWVFTITDKMAFIKAIAKEKAPIEAMVIDESWLGADVRNRHDRAVPDENGELYLYPGVKIYKETRASVLSR